jgi:hypothetical protein
MRTPFLGGENAKRATKRTAKVNVSGDALRIDRAIQGSGSPGDWDARGLGLADLVS